MKGEDNITYCPTSFPNPINYGLAWNKTLAFEMGAIVAAEARALWLAGAEEENGSRGPVRLSIGLDCWSPNINGINDPRWGRNQETASEDILLTGDFGVQYTIGLQTGPDPAFLQTVVTLKLWAAYNLEDADNFTRHSFNAIVSNFSLADFYFPPFASSVMVGNAAGVMCSYNAINGVPTCASSFLNNTLRGAWGFDGYVTRCAPPHL